MDLFKQNLHNASSAVVLYTTSSIEEVNNLKLGFADFSRISSLEGNLGGGGIMQTEKHACGIKYLAVHTWPAEKWMRERECVCVCERDSVCGSGV